MRTTIYLLEETSVRFTLAGSTDCLLRLFSSKNIHSHTLRGVAMCHRGKDLMRRTSLPQLLKGLSWLFSDKSLFQPYFQRAAGIIKSSSAAPGNAGCENMAIIRSIFTALVILKHTPLLWKPTCVIFGRKWSPLSAPYINSPRLSLSSLSYFLMYHSAWHQTTVIIYIVTLSQLIQ